MQRRKQGESIRSDRRQGKRGKNEVKKSHHVSDAIVEPDNEGKEDKEKGDRVLVGHCKARKPEN